MRFLFGLFFVLVCFGVVFVSLFVLIFKYQFCIQIVHVNIIFFLWAKQSVKDLLLS